jgi:hypothetical protein
VEELRAATRFEPESLECYTTRVWRQSSTACSLTSLRMEMRFARRKLHRTVGNALFSQFQQVGRVRMVV